MQRSTHTDWKSVVDSGSVVSSNLQDELLQEKSSSSSSAINEGAGTSQSFFDAKHARVRHDSSDSSASDSSDLVMTDPDWDAYLAKTSIREKLNSGSSGYS